MSRIDFSKLTLMDALDTAILIEEEAAERYQEFVQMLGAGRDGDASDVFVAMAKSEAKHEQDLRARRKKLFGDAPARVDRSMIWDVEAPAQSSPRAFMSKTEAMRVALSGEVKAYEFFEQALKGVSDASVRELFVELRNEELIHQTVLKEWMAGHPAEEPADRTADEIEEPAGL